MHSRSTRGASPTAGCCSPAREAGIADPRMTDGIFTRCPGCSTVFRVTAAQLSLREGQVRCGHCRAVFDANDHFVSVEILGADEFGADDELIRGRPTVTLRSADALLPVPH